MRIRVIKYPIIPITLFMVSGIFFSGTTSYLPEKSILVWLFSLGCLIFLLTHYRLKSCIQQKWMRITSLVSLFFSSFLLGMLLFSFHYTQPLEIKNKLYKGRVTVVEELKPTQKYHRYFAKFNNDSLQFLVLYHQPREKEKLSVGNQLWINEFINPIMEVKNPHTFDYKQFLEKKNVHYQIYQKNRFWTLEDEKNINYYIVQWRDELLKSYDKFNFPSEVKGITDALLMGVRDGLTDEVENDYRMAGVFHVLAISGLHVGIIYYIFNKIISLFVYSKKWRFALLVGILVFFAFLSGLRPSIIRAVLMFSLLGYSTIIARKIDSYAILIHSMFFLVLFNPLSVFDIGFQLSYSAVFSILWIYPQIQKYTESSNVFYRYIKEVIAISVVAQLGVLPLTLYYFGQIPLLFIFGNLIVIPLITLILILLLLMLPFNFVMDSVSSILAKLVVFLVELSNAYTSFLASFKHLVWSEIKISIIGAIALMLFVYCVGYYFKRKEKQYIIYALSFIILFQIDIIVDKVNKMNSEECVLFYDYQEIVLLQKKKANAIVYSTKGEEIQKAQYIKDYQRENRLESIVFEKIKNVLISDMKILVVDGEVCIDNAEVDLLVLKSNPKINLERLLDKTQPKQVVFHNDNSINNKRLWEATCRNKKIPFHDMREKGYIRF